MEHQQPHAQVLFIHARLIAETGGATGLRDLGLLEATVARPHHIRTVFAARAGAWLLVQEFEERAGLAAMMGEVDGRIEALRRVLLVSMEEAAP